MHADRRQLEFRLRNCWDDVVQRPSESIFLGVSALGFLAFAVVLLDPHWAHLLAPHSLWSGWRVSIAVGLSIAVAIALLAHRRSTALAHAQQADWLAAMPIHIRERRAHRRALIVAQTTIGVLLLFALLGWGLLRAGSEPTPLAVAIAAGSLLGLLVSLRTADTSVIAQDRSLEGPLAAAVKIGPGVQGLGLLGAAIEPGLARLSRSARWVAFGLLLIPVGVPGLALIVVALLFGSFGLSVDLIRHWRARYAIDLAWLVAQPLPPRRLLGAYVPVLAKRACGLLLVFGVSLGATGAPLWFAFGSTSLLALLLAHAVLVSYATRGQQRRFPLLMSTHYLMLFASLQIFPPLAPIALFLCLLHAWRRGERNA